MDIKVLCLDDEASIRMSLERSLRRFFSVKMTACYDETLNYLEETKPDIFICDQFVGQEDPIEFMKKVESTYPDLPVLLLTGDSESEQINEFKKINNFKAVLTKPIHSADLKQAILDNVSNASLS